MFGLTLTVYGSEIVSVMTFIGNGIEIVTGLILIAYGSEIVSIL